MNEKERKVLNSLCNGDITFSEASEKLGVPKTKIEEMLEGYNWVPPSERLAELVEIEMETISYIKEISQPINIKVTQSKQTLNKTETFEISTNTGILDMLNPVFELKPMFSISGNVMVDNIISYTQDTRIGYV